jgi:hypothetical protein
VVRTNPTSFNSLYQAKRKRKKKNKGYFVRLNLRLTDSDGLSDETGISGHFICIILCRQSDNAKYMEEIQK